MPAFPGISSQAHRPALISLLMSARQRPKPSRVLDQCDAGVLRLLIQRSSFGIKQLDSDNAINERTSMKTIITLLRILFGILVGLAGCIASLNENPKED